MRDIHVLEVVLPAFTESMEQGTIVSWLVSDGEKVSLGDELVEIETDKSVVTLSGEGNGIIHIQEAEGKTCIVGSVLARIEEAEDSVEVETAVGGVGGTAIEEEDATPNISTLDLTTVKTSSVLFTEAATDDAINDAEHQVADPLSTPQARRLAIIHGVKLGTVRGSGPRGRVTVRDVLAAAELEPLPNVVDFTKAVPSRLAGDTNPRPETLPAKGDRLLKLTRLQKVVADRMSESNATIPTFGVQIDVNLDRAVELRNALRRDVVGEVVPSLNDLIIKACAMALHEVPMANASYTDDGYQLHSRINIGFAVAFEGKLLVPTLFDADTMSLFDISRETRRLADRVRSAQVTPIELSGGTFTVSNLGMFGMTTISPLINPPQSAIVGVGSLRNTIARHEGEIVDRAELTLTLNCDHRVLYGSDAARLLANIRSRMESPLVLVA